MSRTDALPGLLTRLESFVRTKGRPSIVDSVRNRWSQLENLTEAALHDESQKLRRQILDVGVDDQSSLIDAMSLMASSLQRTCGIRLYDVQITAANVMASGGIAEMQTGEGKTYACAPPVFLHALTGRGVHVATTNSYLAGRDHDLLRPAFQLLGLTTSVLEEGLSKPEKCKAYRCDITFATGSDFGFDYLRDQLTLRVQTSQNLSSRFLNRLSGNTGSDLFQRGLYYTVIDEADSVLLDDATSPLVLSGGEEQLAPDADVYIAANEAVSVLDADHDYVVSPNGLVHLTPNGRLRVASLGENIRIELLQKTWAEYVTMSIRARRFRRDVDYVIDEEKIQIVDPSTGRIFQDRTWRDGLHQAVEAKEGVPITNEKETLAQITRQRFARRYERLAGATGTATGCEREFQKIYGLGIYPIPLRTPCQRVVLPTRSFSTKETKWKAIVESVQNLHAQGRPILVGTNNIHDSQRLAEMFSVAGLTYQLLNGRQDEEEATIIARAGERNAVTIATSLAGRGTDILLGSGVAELGGLHVIVTECNESTRVDRQLIGRCARQGDPGSAQSFLSAQDELITKHGNWLASGIVRNGDAAGECITDIAPQIRRLQRNAERKAYAKRYSLYQKDNR